MTTSRGIDVSAHQGAQHWAEHKADGVAFAFAKASEGQHSRDPRFTTHIKGIQAAGLIAGAYHFAWPNQSAATEAANYIGAVKPYAGKGFVHWLDLERYSDGRNYKGRSAAQIKAYVTAWIAAVEKAFPGQRVGVYTSADDLAHGHVPSGVPLWYPAYPGASVDSYAEAEKRSRPKPSGKSPEFWQFVGSPLDRSVCYMSAADLRAWAGGVPSESGSTPAKPKVSLAHVVYAARHDPAASQGHTTYRAEVLTIERALKAEGLLASTFVDGSFGTKTMESYARWQRSPAGGGYVGKDADGIPGKSSLQRLGAKHGFTVTA
jgi:GH25 family lysozyme M1 (1,4-beta-N-acetylmuramidase)